MNKDLQELLSDKESLVSLVLGIIVVVLSGILVFNLVKNKVLTKTAPQTEKVATEPGAPVGEKISRNFPVKHTVLEEETLWDISVKYYGSGYNWIEIARENKLENPDIITKGQTLNIPKAEVKSTEGNINVNGVQTIADSTYTVNKGDDLWNIACRAYNNCYRYLDIAKANNLPNPSEIEIGQILKLPR